MTDGDRFKLLIDPYRPPKVCRGDRATCLFRNDDVVVTGWSDAPISWPRCRALGTRGGGSGLLVDEELARAVRHESAAAVRHHWGVDTQTVWQWRKALGVPRENEGTTALRKEYGREEWFAEARAKAHAKARDPEGRAKIAASRRGKPLSDEHRRKLSAAQRRRGARPPKAGRPWSAAEDVLLRNLPAAVVAAKTGRTLAAVYSRRLVLGLPDGRRR